MKILIFKSPVFCFIIFFSIVQISQIINKSVAAKLKEPKISVAVKIKEAEITVAMKLKKTEVKSKTYSRNCRPDASAPGSSLNPQKFFP